MVEILEPINVWVLFQDTRPKPHLFFWNNRPIKVDKVNLVHSSKEGSSVFYHFSVSANSNFYRLKFDTHNLKWFLEGVEEG